MPRKATSYLLIFSVVLVLLVGVVGCGSTQQQSTSNSSQKQYTIAVLIANMPDYFYLSTYYGFVKEAQKLGNVKVIGQDAGGYTNINKQVNQIDEEITNKVDAIDLAAVSPAGTASAVGRAWQANIPVVGFISTTNGKMAFYVGSSQEQMALDDAKYTVQALNGKGNVVMLNGPPGVSWSTQKEKAFKDYMAKYPGIHILAEKWTQSDRASGMTDMENLLQAFPNTNAVYTGSDAIADGVAAALVAAGKGGKMVVTSAALDPDTQTYIEKGVISMTAAQQTVVIGETTLDDTIKYLEHQSIPQTVTVPDLIVTKDNVSTVDLSTVLCPPGFHP